MNIFVLSEDVKEAAEWHVDRHVVKMPLETAQMLCTALSLNGNSNVEYKPAFFKHPCTIWAAATRDNFEWLCRLGVELCSNTLIGMKESMLQKRSFAAAMRNIPVYQQVH